MIASSCEATAYAIGNRACIPSVATAIIAQWIIERKTAGMRRIGVLNNRSCDRGRGTCLNRDRWGGRRHSNRAAHLERCRDVGMRNEKLVRHKEIHAPAATTYKQEEEYRQHNDD